VHINLIAPVIFLLLFGLFAHMQLACYGYLFVITWVFFACCFDASVIRLLLLELFAHANLSAPVICLLLFELHVQIKFDFPDYLFVIIWIQFRSVLRLFSCYYLRVFGLFFSGSVICLLFPSDLCTQNPCVPVICLVFCGLLVHAKFACFGYLLVII